MVLDDADFAAVIPKLAQGAFTRAGQICFAVKRVYVPQRRFEEFYEQLCAAVDGYRVGYGLDEQATFGPLISARELDRVRGLAERARSACGELRAFGRPTDSVDWDGGHYMLPTVARGLAPDAELVAVEQFGPVPPVLPYASEDEAVTLAATAPSTAWRPRSGAPTPAAPSPWPADSRPGVFRQQPQPVLAVVRHAVRRREAQRPRP